MGGRTLAMPFLTVAAGQLTRPEEVKRGVVRNIGDVHMLPFTSMCVSV